MTLNRLILLVCCSFFFQGTLANNVQIDQVKPLSEVELSFNFSWDNAWNFKDSIAPYNHDALWIFIKGQQADGSWKHLSINSNESIVIDSDFSAVKVEDGMGFYVHLSSFGSASNINGEVQVSIATDDLMAFRAISVYAIEMVYVSEGAFYVGDDSSNFTLGDGQTSESFLIDDSDEISVGKSENQLWSRGEIHRLSGNIPAAYPKGFDAFYCMKYEISQEQYVDFLNTLSRVQQEARALDLPSTSICISNPPNEIERNGIVLIEERLEDFNDIYGHDFTFDNKFNAENDGQNIACNFLSWSDFSAYLDWSALRPMTELEFEKASRGFDQSVPLEFAWGSDGVQNAISLLNSGLETETVSEQGLETKGLANYGYCAPSGPIRCGFAATGLTNRITSGASYFGIMELSGNLWESVISLNKQGLDYDGIHGDGQLTDDGSGDVENWYAVDGKSAGIRGGAWNSGVLSGFRDLAVSDRFNGFYNTNSYRQGTVGGRGVRSVE